MSATGLSSAAVFRQPPLRQEQNMDNVFEAVVETDGRIKLTSPQDLKRGCRVLVTIPDEDEAWSHL